VYDYTERVRSYVTRRRRRCWAVVGLVGEGGRARRGQRRAARKRRWHGQEALVVHRRRRFHNTPQHTFGDTRWTTLVVPSTRVSRPDAPLRGRRLIIKPASRRARARSRIYTSRPSGPSVRVPPNTAPPGVVALCPSPTSSSSPLPRFPLRSTTTKPSSVRPSSFFTGHHLRHR